MVNKDSHIVDGRMVVVERGKCPTPCKKGAALSGRKQCPRNMSRKMSRSPLRPMVSKIRLVVLPGGKNCVIYCHH